jgi:5-methylcytosine-specific restriction endonuclease McrA
MTADEVREFKRNSMARRRKENPEAVRATDRKRYAKRRAEVKVYVKAWREKHFFGARVGRIKGSTAADLARIWKNQRGRCAYTGKKLDRSAQMDHIIPRALGGTDDLCNIQWVCPEINYAKRDLTHAQFIEMCGSVVEWIGKRIQMVEELINGIS